MKKIVFLLLFLPSICFALTLSGMRTQIKDDVGDPSTNITTQRYSSSTVNTLINQGQREIADTVWCIYTSSTITLSANTTYYTLPTNTAFVDRVVYNSTTVLPKIPIPILDREATWLTTAAGTPTSWHINFEKTKLGLCPEPSATGTLDIYYVKVPTDLSNDSDVPFDGIVDLYSYHHLLVYYVDAMIFFKEGKVNEYQLMIANYQQGLSRMYRTLRMNDKTVTIQQGVTQ